MTRYRRRSVALAALAALLLIGSMVSGGGEGADRADPFVQLVSVRRPVAAGDRVVAADLAVTTVPSRYANPHQLTDPSAAVGHRTAVSLTAGSPLMDAELAEDGAPPRSRDVTVRLDDVAGLPAGDLAGTTADLYLVVAGTPPLVRIVIRDVRVVGSSSTDGAMVATLRVSSADVAVLIEAESAGGLRLVGRPAG